MTSSETFILEIPASAEHVGTARAFAVALLRELGAPEERVLDARLAVSEACTDAIVALGGVGRLELRLTGGGGGLLVEVDAPGGLQRSGIDPSDLLDAGFGRLELIRSLFPDAELVQGSDGAPTRLRFSVPLG